MHYPQDLNVQINPAEAAALQRLDQLRSRLAACITAFPGSWNSAETQEVCQDLCRSAASLRDHLCVHLEAHPARLPFPAPPGSALFWVSRFLEECMIFEGSVYHWLPWEADTADLHGGGSDFHALYSLKTQQRGHSRAKWVLSLLALQPADNSGVRLQVSRPVQVTGPWAAGDPHRDPDDDETAVLCGGELHWNHSSVRLPQVVSYAALLGALQACAAPKTQSPLA